MPPAQCSQLPRAGELEGLLSTAWLTHLPVWHAAVAAEVQGSWHSGSGDSREVAVQAGCQAEGQAGPAAQEDVDSREGQGAQDEEQKATLKRTVAVCLGGTFG